MVTAVRASSSTVIIGSASCDFAARRATFGEDIAGVQYGANYVVVAPFKRNGFCETDESMLGGVIGRGIGAAHLRADRANVNDAPAPLLFHDGHGLAGAEEWACKIHRQDLLPGLQRQFLKWPAVKGPRVVDQDIYAAKFLHGARKERFDFAFVGDIGRVRRVP